MMEIGRRTGIRRRKVDPDGATQGTGAVEGAVLLPPAAQPALRERFRQYVDAWMAVYRKLPDLDAAKSELSGVAALQRKIWALAVAARQQASSPAVMTLVLSARTVALGTHPPQVVPVMLTVFVCACVFP